MGTDKRARQKELHRTRLEQARREAAAAARRRRLFTIGGAVIAVAVVVGVIVVLTGGEDTDGNAAKSTTTTTAAGPTTTGGEGPQPAVLKGPGAGEAVKGETPCPKADGSSPRTTSFEQAPPTCIDPKKTYQAVFTTSKGEFTADLYTDQAPKTVNNFVVLARYRFYDGIPFHRIVPDFVIQAGDPSDSPNGQGGPGYTIGEEPPADKTYDKYELAMAKTQAPNSTGSQFFVVTGDPTGLNQVATYSLFGKVTAGTETVDAIAATPVAGPSNDSPSEQVTIESVRIIEK